MFKPKIVRPQVDRETYTLQTIEQVFPGGEWVDNPQEGEAEVVEAPGCEPGTLEGSSPSSLSLTVIGGANDALRKLLIERAPERVICGTTLTGRGGEREAAKMAEKLGIEVEMIGPDVELFGAKAAEVNVLHVMVQDFDSPLVIVGNGTRAKQAKAKMASARFTREVIEL